VKTDSIFYRLFQEFPSIFFELIGNSPETASTYQFSSVEVKQTTFRIDGVFLPTQTEENPIYFLEVQFQADSEIYSRLFTEICLYLRQNKPENDWGAAVVYKSRSLDTGNIKHYREFFASERVKRIYLDELGEGASLPIGVATIKLVVADEDEALLQARELIDRTRQELNSQLQQQILQLIETILFYKFPTMSRQELEAMFGLSEFKQTRVYQETLEEGERKAKLESIPRFLGLGLSIEQIAQGLGLSVEEVRQVTQQQPPNSPGDS
jgi:predicted transposase/invertase (TIGR01784 family)